MKYCPISGTLTFCDDHCKNCAKESHADLKIKMPKADYASEDTIKNCVGEQEFELMREHGLIECCTTIQGKKMYAI